MKTKEIIILSILILIISCGLTVIFYSFYIIKDVKKITMDLIVDDSGIVGVNSDTDGLHFGTVPRKGSSTRRMIINHKENYPVYVSIHAYGPFLEWLNISDYNLYLEPNEDREIKFTVKVPENADSGIYNGTVIVVTRRRSLFS
jgi:hypothetical protein